MFKHNNAHTNSTIQLTKSSGLTLFFIAIITAIIGALYCINLPPYLSLISIVLVVCTGSYAIGQYAWLTLPSSVCTIYTRLDSNDQLRVTIKYKAGTQHDVKPQPDTLINPLLSVLVFKLSATSMWTRKVLITCDNCDSEQFRKLRVISRMSNLTTTKPVLSL